VGTCRSAQTGVCRRWRCALCAEPVTDCFGGGGGPRFLAFCLCCVLVRRALCLFFIERFSSQYSVRVRVRARAGPARAHSRIRIRILLSDQHRARIVALALGPRPSALLSTPVKPRQTKTNTHNTHMKTWRWRAATNNKAQHKEGRSKRTPRARPRCRLLPFALWPLPLLPAACCLGAWACPRPQPAIRHEICYALCDMMSTN
jgi:hypothetical protein